MESREAPSGNLLSLAYEVPNLSQVMKSTVTSAQFMAVNYNVVKAAAPSSATLETRVLNYAKSYLGKKCGTGQCADLADKALRAAGAKTFYQLGPTGSNADYVWGRLVYFKEIWRSGPASGGGETVTRYGIHAGDIIQFRNVILKDSSGTRTAQHHTAIVKECLSGNRFRILEQNSGGKLYVQERIINLNAMTQGKIWIYQPIA
jgi:hypothetical protein